MYLHLYPESICWLCLSVVGIFRWCLLCLEFNCLQIGVPWLLFLFYFPFHKHYMLNKNRKSRHPCPVPDFKDNASSFSLFSMTFAVILWCFIVLKCISCITRFSRFCHKRLLQFVLFLHSLRWLCDFWIWFSTFIDLHWLNYPWFYGIKLIWPRWIIFLSLSCIQFVFFWELHNLLLFTCQ